MNFHKLVFCAIFGLVSCGKSYDSFQIGEFKGRLIVEWYKPDEFIYRPADDDPLVFARSNEETYVPRTFTTDGGSIPQILRAVKNYSPWGYAKSYIIHDWVFAEHFCGRLENVSFDDSADILSEAIKTEIMARGLENDPSGPKVLSTIDAAVRSKIAEDHWNTGECKPFEETGLESNRTPDAVFVIE